MTTTSKTADHIGYLRGEGEMRELLYKIDYPSTMPEEVISFVVSHAGMPKAPGGVMNILEGAFGKWKSQQPDLDWPHAIAHSGVVPEVAAALTGDLQLALQGLFIAAFSGPSR